jgi:hypothetical protein
MAQFEFPLNALNISRVGQMKNTSGSTKAGPLTPIPLYRAVAITKIRRPVQSREQMEPATNDIK